MLLAPITNDFLLKVALASKAPITSEMKEFIAAIPANFNEAAEDAIEGFDKLLDEMEGV